MAKWNVGQKNGQWKGGRSVTQHGYVLIRVGKDHPLADVRGYAYEHRINAEKALGRPLAKGEIVHHKNTELGKENNSTSNLRVVNMTEHRFLHRKRQDLRKPNEPNPTINCECGCNQTFPKYDSSGRPRRFVSGHNRNKDK